MNSLFEAIQTTIQNHTLAGIPKSTEQVHPCYDGYSIANIPASICGWLGCPLPAGRSLAPIITEKFHDQYNHIILVVIDGCGLDFLRFHHLDPNSPQPSSDWQRVLNDGLFFPLTSLAPSTTAAALTTFWTAKLPAEHGVIAYEVFLKEYGVIANMVTHAVTAINATQGNLAQADFKPKQFLPVTTLGYYLKKANIHSFALQHQSIADSGLSQMLLEGTHRLPFQSLPEIWKTALDIHHRYSRQRTYTYIYWGELDTLSHRVGPHSQQLCELWRNFSTLLVDFILQLRKLKVPRTLVVLTADHGQIGTEISSNFEMRHHPELTRHLIMQPSGEGRLPFLFVKCEHAKDVDDYLKNHWDQQFSLVPSEVVLKAGLLGNCEPSPAVRDRLGQFVVFPQKNAYWWWAPKENHLLGRHGGLSQAEMLVPLIAYEI